MSVELHEGCWRTMCKGIAEIIAHRDGYWFGRIADDHKQVLPCACVWDKNGKSLQLNSSFDITGPWAEKPDPGKDHRLLGDDEYPQRGDEFLLGGCKNWMPSTVFDTTVGSQCSNSDIIAYRRRSEPPFRISDHGPGVYQTRDGREATVHTLDSPRHPGRPVIGRIADMHCDFAWSDDGLNQPSRKESPSDLVCYLHQPEPEWKPTGEMKWIPIPLRTPACVCLAPESGSGDVRWAQLMREFSNGVDSEWRPVEEEHVQ